MRRNATRTTIVALTVLAIALPSLAHAKRKTGPSPVTDTLAGLTIGELQPPKPGWEMSSPLVFSQPPQRFFRDDTYYDVTTRYRIDDSQRITSVTLQIHYPDATRCQATFLETFAAYANAHQKPTDPGGNHVSWPTQDALTLHWESRCHTLNPTFSMHLE